MHAVLASLTERCQPNTWEILHTPESPELNVCIVRSKSAKPAPMNSFVHRLQIFNSFRWNETRQEFRNGTTGNKNNNHRCRFHAWTDSKRTLKSLPAHVLVLADGERERGRKNFPLIPPGLLIMSGNKLQKLPAAACRHCDSIHFLIPVNAWHGKQFRDRQEEEGRAARLLEY